MKKNVFIISILMLFIACEKKEVSISEIPFEFGINNAEPNLVAENGKLSMSWIQSVRGEEATLFYSQLENEKWNAPIKITSGNDWFVNWADFPSNATNGDVLLTSHLKKSAAGTYTYDVVLNLRKLNGEIIKEDFLLNTDGVQAEHGFVSVIPNASDGFFITWLDGRNTVAEMNESHHKAMTIRTAEVSKDGTVFNEVQLDGKTCDCCQTSITATANGPLIVYRDRSNTEIRDIYYSEQINGVWNEPKVVFNDNWKINGCPVNGPKVVSNKKITAVAWFTGADDNPKVKLAFSSGSNLNFKEPIVLNDLAGIGRVDVAFVNENEVLVTYMETDEIKTYLRCKKVSVSGKVSKAFTISEIDASRSTGVPQLEIVNKNAYVVWTVSEDKKNQLKTVKFLFEGLV
jgi:hypothetical protein